MAKVKGKRMDINLVSNQIWELKYVAKKFNTTVHAVRVAKSEVGRSRRRLYAYLRTLTS